MDKVNFNPFSEILVEDFLRQSGYIGDAFNLIIADFLCQSMAVLGLAVTAQSVADMTVYVKPGRLYQAGQQGQLTVNLDPALTITAAHPDYDRIDRICAQYHEVQDTPETRNVMVDTVSRQVTQKSVMTRMAGAIDFMVINGVAAPGPAAPTVPDGWVSLAQVKVRANTTSILQTDILDERPTLKSLMTHAHSGGIDGAQVDYANLKNKPAIVSNVWKPNTPYAVGDIAYSAKLPSWAYLECIQAGTSGNDDNIFTKISSGGGVISDNTAQWAVRDLRVSDAQFDNSAKLATTAYLKSAGMFYGKIVTVGGTTTLDASYAGKVIQLYSASAFTVTLPLTTNIPSGEVLTFINRNTGTANISVSGSDGIAAGITNLSTISLKNGDALTLISNGNGSWYALGGSSVLGYTGSFVASLASNGYQKLPSGLIIQWGQNNFSTVSATFNFPIAFPNACFQLVANDIGGGAHSLGVSPTSQSQYTIVQGSAQGTTFRFIAIGW